MLERERALNQQIEENSPQQEVQGTSGYFGLNLDDINRMGGSIPGFQTIKDRVIKPLIVATEKVVEYYFQEEPSA